MSLSFSNGGVLVTSVDELPELNGRELFLDLETTSFNKTVRSVNPWHDCFVLGIAIRLDDSPTYYIPINHATKAGDKYQNLDALVVQAWLKLTLDRVRMRGGYWVNHNVKYDCQVLYARFGVDADLQMFCTLDLAKLIDSDRFKFSLDALSHDWLKEDISKYENAFKPYLTKNKDYGWIPIDIMAEYACQDVLTNARLWKYIKTNMPEESRGVMTTSSECLTVLVEIERNGMRVNPTQVMLAELKALNRMAIIQQELHEILGYTIEPHVNKDCFDVLVNKLGLPVVSWNESGNPSFDKEALIRYKALPNVAGTTTQILDLMLEYRKLQTFTSLFTKTFRKLHIKGLLHSTYKQTVRTGRMACAMPNQQQNSKLSKELIVCEEDEVIITVDYCLAAGTQVITSNGNKPIEELKIGDRVLSVHPKSTRMKFIAITKTAVKPAEPLLELTLDNGDKVRCTKDHTFITFDGDKVLASALTLGQRLLHVGEAMQGEGEVVSIKCVEAEPTYCVTVPENHTFVLANGLVSGNCQIEFRVIVHYIQDLAAIKAYQDNPFTDFHQWVAEVCHVHRRPAKTVNFLMGYGGGQNKLVGQLVQIPELVGDIQLEVDKLGLTPEKAAERFHQLALQRGRQVYYTYHETMPGLKRTSRQAADRVHERGYCVNKYGRRRHLSTQGAHRAFNSVCQGTAADLMKERLVALSKWLKRYFPTIVLIGVVHDEVILRAPKHLVESEGWDLLLDSICFILEDISVELRVPIRTSIGFSEKSWLDASENQKERHFDRKTFVLEGEKLQGALEI